MSVKINIGRYRLESYSMGWTIGKPKNVTRTDAETGEKTEHEQLADQRFPGTLTQALTTLQDVWMRESEAETCEELLAELKSFRAELAGLFTIQAKEPAPKRSRKFA